jgi:uncharacterized membrane protein
MAEDDRPLVADVRAIDRIAFFSDAVVAIAMTLLGIQLRLPITTTSVTLAHDLGQLGDQYVSFVLSFIVIAMFWRSHHRRFDVLVAYDDRLIALNTLFLLSIVFLPFPTEVLGRYGGRTATIFYASSMLVAGLASLLNAWYVFRVRLVSDRLTSRDRAADMWRGAAFVAMFGLSIPVAFLSVGAAQVMWVAAVVLRRLASLAARRGDRTA